MKYLTFPLLALAAFLVSSCGRLAKLNGDSHIEKGGDAYENGDFVTARNELQSGLEGSLSAYTKADVYGLLGLTYYELDKYDSAIYYHKLALEEKPDYNDVWVNMGITYRAMGEYEMAESCYLKAEKVMPHDPELLVSMGVLYNFMGEPLKSVEYLRKALKADPKQPVAHANYALALAKIGDFDSSQIEYEKAMELNYPNMERLREMIDEVKTDMPVGMPENEE